MAIFRCNKCGHIREVGNDYIGKSVKCPKCDYVTPIRDTVAFFNAIIKKHVALNDELKKLRGELNLEGPIDDKTENVSFEDIDIYNTKVLSQINQLEPIVTWFGKRQIKIDINHEAVDTTGFFDEIALALGNNIDVLSFASNQIKYIQNKGYTNVKIDLAKKKAEEIQQITSFCKRLHDYSFVAKYFYIKKEKIIRITLQKAPKIRAFFNGIWMEWFVLMKALELFRDKKIAPACARSIQVSFANGRSNELDLFFLTENGTPVCIECKTGEFRQDINKYLSLRKQLNISKQQFVICVFGLSQEQALGMTSMYDVTFVTEKTLIDHIQSIL